MSKEAASRAASAYLHVYSMGSGSSSPARSAPTQERVTRHGQDARRFALDPVPLRWAFTHRGPDLGDREGGSPEAHGQASFNGQNAAPDPPRGAWKNPCIPPPVTLPATFRRALAVVHDQTPAVVLIGARRQAISVRYVQWARHVIQVGRDLHRHIS
jgi:hypothetical protein